MDEEIPLLNVESDEEETVVKQFYDGDNVLPAPESGCNNDNEETVVKLIHTPNDSTAESLHGGHGAYEGEFRNLHPHNFADHSNPMSTISTQDSEISETSLKRLCNVHEIDELSDILPNNRLLPEGKSFHIFVSFCGKDQDLVKPIVTVLEQEGLRCMFHDRDFIAGKGIIDNIVDTLHQSQKVLLMLTENYTQSGPCMFEQNQALYFYSLVERREHCIIPVKLLPCAVPPQLQRLTYIDAELETTSLVDKIIESYDTNDTADCYVPKAPLYELGYPFPINDVHPVNGSLALHVSASKILSGCRGAGWHFMELTESQEQKLQKARLQEAVGAYEIIRRVINSLWFMKLHDMFICGKRCALSVCLFIFTMTFFFFQTLSLETTIYNIADLIIILLGVVAFGVLTCCLSPCFIKLVMLQARKQFISTLWKVGKEYFVNSKFFIVLGDANLLKEYIVRALEGRASPTQVKIMADRLLESAIVKQFYKDVLVWSNLQESDERRHGYPIYYNRVCLCQQAGIEIHDNGVTNDVIIV